jgi:uncharacterized protein (DUF2235 family)
MGKKLVLCLDGTSNRYCKDNTNVVKLAALLDKKSPDQMLYYQPGIGTIAPPGVFSGTMKRVLRTLDLAFAILLKHHVQDAYRYLMRYYTPGDEIYLFGFSRGAYTARVLAGMLCEVGLLQQGNEELVPFAWERYAGKRDVAQSRGFRDTFSRPVRIRFMGLWDTVSSVRYAWRDRSFPHTRDNWIVDRVSLAVALDERRAYFRQNLWTSKPRDGQIVRQVWFPGVHCDVGGGYKEAESGLSKIALEWMLDQVGGALAFDQKRVEALLPESDTDGIAAPCVTAKMHQSLRGWWHVVELIPKRVNFEQPDGSYEPHWVLPMGRSRQVRDGAVLHKSVRERMAADAAYKPGNLPKRMSYDGAGPTEQLVGAESAGSS